MKNYEAQYRKEINSYLKCGEDNIYFYWKGRVALYALLKAMGVGPGDEVIVQGYTCVVVANSIIYLGAKPVYVDIDLSTYNMNIEQMKEKITDKTKVIICQNTYGLSSNLEVLEQIAKEKGIYTLEDCTHGFGGYYNGKPNGTSCDASFFSTQWSKPYTTGVGGFCVVHDEKLRQKLADVNKDLVDPSWKECMELKLMYFVRTYIINDITYWPMIRLYRWLSRRNLVVGSSSGEEVEGTKMPEGFFKKQSSVQFKKGIKSLKKLDDVNRLRKENAKKYTAVLKELGKTYVSEDLFDNHIFIRYPLLVKDRDGFRELAEKEGIILGEWFESPIYPAYNSYDVWSLKVEELPNAMWVCERMVNLETTEKKVEKVLEFLKKHAEYLV